MLYLLILVTYLCLLLFPNLRPESLPYEKGVKVLPHELKQYLPSWQRSETLPKWDITIIPF